jgi:hypothetical protein
MAVLLGALVAVDCDYFTYDDGGRSEAGYKGSTGDCATRAIAIASGKPYQEVYASLNRLAKHEHTTARRSSARTGVKRPVYETYLLSLGFTWVPTMRVGQGCTVHLHPSELPKGRLVVSLSKHLTAVIDGVVHDTYDPSRMGTRCVYGYYVAPQG